jgi:hypothetical protein
MPNFTESVFRGIKQGEDISQAPARSRAQQLSLEGQQLGLDQKQAEHQRFLEDSNLKSMVDGALQFSVINPNDNQAQIQFLQNRVEEINDRGGDPRDTLELIQQTPQQRQQTIQSVLSIGQQKGLLKSPIQQKQDLTQMAKGLIEEGFDPKSKEFQRELTKRRTQKKGSLVTVQTGDNQVQAEDIEFKKALGKQQATRFSNIIKEGEDARNTIAALDQLDNIDVAKGIFEPAKVEFARVLQGFGVDASEVANVANAQAFNAVSTKLVNEVLNAAKGPQTDQDAARARKTIASLGDAPKAAGFKNDALRALALRKVEQQDFIESQIDSGKNFRESINEWNKFKKTTPSLSTIVTTSEGLPVFFFQYQDFQRKTKPNITDSEILENWRVINGN